MKICECVWMFSFVMMMISVVFVCLGDAAAGVT